MKTLQPVGVGTRTLNFLVDTIIVFTLAYFINKALTQYAIMWRRQMVFSFGELFGIVLFTYYFILESLLKRSFGKYFSYTKVVSSNGKKPKIWQLFVRSLVRLTIIDLFFFPFLNERTLHDYLSKTLVVEK